MHIDGREAMHRAGRAMGEGRTAASVSGAVSPSWASAARQRAHLAAIAPDGTVAGGPTVSPIDFGADPTGATDSTAAFTNAMAALLNHSSHAVPPMADAIVNLGGATLDLRGGEYLVSQPLIIPKLVGNVRIRGGSLLASPSFPAGRFLIEVGEEGCNAKVPQAVCNEMIGLDSIFLDAAHVAAGGIKVASTMGTTIGPSSFFTGFVEAGVRVLAGHETQVSESWLAEYYWSDHAPARANSTSIGIDLRGQDNFVTDVIVFDFTKVGVSVDGAATLLHGVHTWNGGGTGILINGSYAIQDRLLACYLDYNSLVLVDPSQTVVEDTFFLDTQAVLHRSEQAAAQKTPMRSVVFRENVYAFGGAAQRGVNTSIVLNGTWVSCAAVTVADELSAKRCTAADDWACGIKQTTARLSVPYAPPSRPAPGTVYKMSLDFGAQLLMPRIDHVQLTLVLDRELDPANQPAPLTYSVQGTTVTAATMSHWFVNGTLHAEVRQCL